VVHLALLQLRPEKGQLEHNLKVLGRALERARAMAEAQGLPPPQLAIAPEAYLSGYFLQGGVRELALTQEELLETLQDLYRELAWEGPLDLILGFYERQGGVYYNAAAYVELGGRGLLHLHRKIFLPTYGVFDEERYLSRGSRVQAFETRLGRAALLICEDFWHSATSMIAALDGAEILYVLAASPARGFQRPLPANVLRWRSLAQAVAAEHGLFVVLSSLVGFEAGRGLSGGSLIADPEGQILKEAPVFEEAVLLAELDLARIPPVRYDSPLLADLAAGLPLLLPDLRRALKVQWGEG
jgi:N-carbamoylputrescine amidase